MTWQYNSMTGELSHDGRVVAHGYSGAGPGRNNPVMQNVQNIGPIPVGQYSIGTPYNTATHGPHVMRLTPQGHNAQGRSGFLIHGDNRTHTASQGCIILDRTIRDQISSSRDTTIQVRQWAPWIGLGVAVGMAITGCSPVQSRSAQTVPQHHAASRSADAPQPAKTKVASDPVLVRLTSDVTRKGPQQYLAHVSDTNPDWRHFLRAVSTGDETALSLVVTLRPSADAGTAESLDTAAAQGLPRAPVIVLQLTRAGATVQSLCTSPFIEPEPGVEKRYNTVALAALDAVPTARRSEPTFSQCRAALAKIAAEL